MYNLHNSKQIDPVNKINDTSRNLHDTLTIDNAEFEHYVSDIY